MAHPSVLEVAVVGAEDESRITKPKAFIVLRDPAAGSAALEQDIIASVAKQLPSFKCPRSVQFVPDLPKTATGKFQRFRLR
jgi:acyl-coenzyme A synthetase/AMP-(fatty) acid ligase